MGRSDKGHFHPGDRYVLAITGWLRAKVTCLISIPVTAIVAAPSAVIAFCDWPLSQDIAWVVGGPVLGDSDNSCPRGPAPWPQGTATPVESHSSELNRMGQSPKDISAVCRRSRQLSPSNRQSSPIDHYLSRPCRVLMDMEHARVCLPIDS